MYQRITQLSSEVLFVITRTFQPPPQAFRVTSAKRERLVTSAKREAPREVPVPFLPCAPIIFSAERRLGTRQRTFHVANSAGCFTKQNSCQFRAATHATRDFQLAIKYTVLQNCDRNLKFIINRKNHPHSKREHGSRSEY